MICVFVCVGKNYQINKLVRPLSKAPNPQLLPGRRNVACPLLQVCVHLDGLNAENTFHSSLYSV